MRLGVLVLLGAAGTPGIDYLTTSYFLYKLHVIRDAKWHTGTGCPTAHPPARSCTPCPSLRRQAARLVLCALPESPLWLTMGWAVGIGSLNPYYNQTSIGC